MTLDVYRGRKTIQQQTTVTSYPAKTAKIANKICVQNLRNISCKLYHTDISKSIGPTV